MAIVVVLPRWGGNWSNGANAGLACLNLNNRRSNVNNNLGLRPALLNARKCILTGNIVRAEKRSYAPSLSVLRSGQARKTYTETGGQYMKIDRRPFHFWACYG
jgi:hypothetical protein